MNDHEHDWWRTKSGGLECKCGASRRPVNDETKEESE